MDSRPKVNAQANAVKGMGYELSSYYQVITDEFLLKLSELRVRVSQYRKYPRDAELYDENNEKRRRSC